METQNTKKNPFTGIIERIKAFFKKLFRIKTGLLPKGASWEDVPLEISDEARRYLEMRHVQEDEVKKVIYHAETSGEKLYQPDGNRYLGKLRIGRATFYAEYSYGKDKFVLIYGYAHRSEIIG